MNQRMALIALFWLGLAGLLAWPLLSGRSPATAPSSPVETFSRPVRPQSPIQLAPRSAASAPAPLNKGADPPRQVHGTRAAPPAPAPGSATQRRSEPIWADDVANRSADALWRAATATLAVEPLHSAALRDALAAGASLGKWAEIAALLADALKIDPRAARLRFERAAALMRVQRWLDAVAELRAGLKVLPDDRAAWHNLAICEQALGRLAAARQTWDQGMPLAEDRAEALARRGETLLDLQEHAAAVEDLRAALELAPERIDCRINLGLALESLGELDQAHAVLDRGLALYPDNPHLLLEAARIVALMHQAAGPEDGAVADELQARALGYCRRALELNPANAAAAALLREIDIKANGPHAEPPPAP